MLRGIPGGRDGDSTPAVRPAQEKQGGSKLPHSTSLAGSRRHDRFRGGNAMRRMNRRQFAKVAGATVALGSAAGELWARERDAGLKPGATQTPQQPAGPSAAAKPKLTPEQEEKVKQAVERRERQLAGLRGRTLAYSAEPAFVFRAKMNKPR
jgi:hypothetical protein